MHFKCVGLEKLPIMRSICTLSVRGQKSCPLCGVYALLVCGARKAAHYAEYMYIECMGPEKLPIMRSICTLSVWGQKSCQLCGAYVH